MLGVMADIWIPLHTHKISIRATSDYIQLNFIYRILSLHLSLLPINTTMPWVD